MRQWLTAVELYWGQAQFNDPVMMVLSQLEDHAADWRDSTLRAAFNNSFSKIPCAEFKALFESKFITVDMKLEAHKAFHSIQQGDLSAEAINSHFNVAVAEIAAMGESPWGMVPAPAAQAQTYLAALHPALLRVLQTTLHKHDLLNLQVLQNAAANADTARRAFAVGSHKTSKSDTAHNSAPKSNNSKRNKRFAKQANLTRLPGPPAQAFLQAALPAPPASGRSNNSKRTAQGNHKPAFTPKKKDDGSYIKGCPHCGGHDHTGWECTVRSSPHAAAVITASTQHGSSMRRMNARSSTATALAAPAADPKLTMLFDGVAGPQGSPLKPCRLLVDTGSTYNFGRPEILKHAKHLGRTQSVTVADGSQVTVGLYSIHLRVQSYSTELQVFGMSLPFDFDIILGNKWCVQNKAALVYDSELCRILCNNTLKEHFLYVPVPLRKQPALRASSHISAAAVRSSVKTSFLVLVQPVQDTSLCMTAMPGTAEVDAKFEAYVELPEMAHDVKQLVAEYNAVFPSDLPHGLPPERQVAHAIPLLPGATPPRKRMYRLSQPERAEVHRQIEDLLAKGFMQPSQSLYGSPILFVKKKDGGLRMCIDFRALNKATIRNNYPLPRIDDLLDQLHGSTVFSCLDLQQAYHQIRLRDEDVQKTAFTTPEGLFEYKVLCFGLTNAPATFQALMNDVLHEHIGKYCLVYLDDILIYSRSPEEHLEHLKRILSSLSKHKLFAKLSKCRFALKQVQFLGHILSADGVQPDHAKVALVSD